MDHAYKVSVVICTRNRGDAISGCLERFGGQFIPRDVSFELVVVDNNSTDHTKDVLLTFGRELPCGLSYLHEEKPGLGRARNRGLEAASGDIIAFTDDDCMVPCDWIASMVHEFRSDPNLAGLGGRVELFDQRDKPVTIRTSTERRVLNTAAGVFSVTGCNMAFRRSVFEKIGPFDAKFGSGTKIPAEDLDFFYRAYAEGFKLIYSPDVVVYHNHGRRTDDEVGALSKQYLIGKGGFYCKHALKGDLNVIKMVYWEILSFVRRMGQMSLGGAYYLGASLLSTFSRSSAKTPNAASRSLGEKKRFSDEAV